jgi:predicted nucleic acid-binding protein
MILSPELFVDTSFLIALLNSTDEHHQQATTLQRMLSEASTRKITSEYILIELGDGLSRLRFRQLAGRLIQLIVLDPTFEIVPASLSLFTKAVALLNVY